MASPTIAPAPAAARPDRYPPQIKPLFYWLGHGCLALLNQVNTTWVLQGDKMTPFHLFG